MNIARRGVELDTNCVVCQGQFEDGGHLFFRCKGVKQFWRVLQLDDVRMDLMKCSGPLYVLERIKLPYERRMTTVVLLWCWWSERNKHFFFRFKEGRGVLYLIVTEVLPKGVEAGEFTTRTQPWQGKREKERKRKKNKICMYTKLATCQPTNASRSCA